ncbi:MAG: rsmA [Firmicutes bacterium]|nr:rsmA [Bacillota bacterium]
MIKPCIAKKEVTTHILKTFGIHTSKKLGQNFLIDENVVQQIVEAAAISATDTVLEIGPGIGTLTQGVAETQAEVVAVELDQRLITVLSKTLDGYDNVRVIHNDILKLDISAEIPNKTFKVVANLPYYITTPIIMNLLEHKLPIELLVTMVQKAVESAVIRCTVRKEPPVKVESEKRFFRVVRAAFAQRRKTLANGLKAAGITAENVNKILEEAGIDSMRRGETLSLDEFALVSNAWEKYQ